MIHLFPRRRLRRAKHQGSTLIEALVSLLVLVLGVLGILGMQLRTLSSAQNSMYRSAAVNLVGDLAERIRANPSNFANISVFTGNWNPTPTVNGCISLAAGCSPEQLAAVNLAQWQLKVAATLPAGNAQVFTSTDEPDALVLAGNKRQLGVMLSWRANEKSDAEDYNKPFVTTSSDKTCPEKRICHLMYVQL